MSAGPFDVDPDIRKAWTPHAAAYRDAQQHERVVQDVLARSWQLVPPASRIDGPCRAQPWTWLEGS